MKKDSDKNNNMKILLEQFNEKPKTQEQKELWDVIDKVATNIEVCNKL